MNSSASTGRYELSVTRCFVRFVSVLLFPVLLGGCTVLDDLLSVEAPSRVVASDLDDPAAAELLVSSVANEFRCALTHYIAASALTGMELTSADRFAVLLIWEVRKHDTSGFGSQYASSDCGGANPALYKPLSRTRWMADQVLTSLGGWSIEEVPEKEDFQAEVAAFAGYSYVLLAESMCSVAFDGGPEQTIDDAFQLAVLRFDQAIETASDSQILNLARVGKARALLNLGQTSDAAATAAQVPSGFSFQLAYSNLDGVTRNKEWELNTRDQRATVGETYRELSYAGDLDPRAAVTDEGVKAVNTDIDVWTADKYSAADSPIEVASWEEAQLIMAAAAVEFGPLSDAVDIINVLHANVGLQPFASTDPVEVMDQLVYERSVELFLEGHHLQDIKRLNIPLVPAPGTPHESGTTYGDEVCFEIPAIEFLNNSNLGVGG
jgi:SusD/RagB-like outer membrane lipoprotein